jgi:hypothetical protein
MERCRQLLALIGERAGEAALVVLAFLWDALANGEGK